jgi:hypothetical protein
MKVFVQYCGGCNPCIDRVGVVKELIRLADGMEVGDDGETSEWRLVMNGCKVGCRETDLDPADARVLFVAGCSVQGEDVEEKDIPVTLLQQIKNRSV